jgi:hypothetical protein
MACTSYAIDNNRSVNRSGRHVEYGGVREMSTKTNSSKPAKNKYDDRCVIDSEHPVRVDVHHHVYRIIIRFRDVLVAAY